MTGLVELLKNKDSIDSHERGTQSILVFGSEGFRDFVEEAYRFEGLTEPDGISLFDVDLEYKLANAKARFLVLDLTDSSDLLQDIAAKSHVIPTEMGVLVVGGEDKISVERHMRTLGYYYTFFNTDKVSFINSVHRVRESIVSTSSHELRRQAKRMAVVGTRGGNGTTLVATLLSKIMSEVHNSHCVLVDQSTMTGNLDVLIGLKHFSKRDLVLGNLSSAMDTGAAMSLTQRVAPRLSVLAMQSSELDGVKLKEYCRSLYLQVGTACHFIIEDVMYGLLSQRDVQLFSKDYDIVVLVLEPSIESLREAAKIRNEIKEQNKAIRILLVVNYTKPEATYVLTLPEIEEVLKASIDIVIPFEARLMQMLIDRENILNQKGKLSAPLQALAKLILGISIANSNTSWSLKRLLRKRT